MFLHNMSCVDELSNPSAVSSTPAPATGPASGEDLHATLAYLDALKAQIERDLARSAPRPGITAMSLAELCELYFQHNPRKVSPATIERDRISARNVCRLIPSSLRPDEIDEPAVIHYRNLREAEGARPRTILNEMSFLRMVLQFGMSWRRVTGMTTVSFLTVPDVGEWDHPGVALSIDEFREALAAVSPVNRRRFIFGVTTMLRRTPLLQLNDEWIDRDAVWLSVPREFMKKGRSKHRSALHVPLSRWAFDQVQDLTPTREGYLWPNGKTGKPMTWVDHIFTDASQKIGIEFSCHDLRTTGATWLADAHVDELVISILLGHRSQFDASRGTHHFHGRNVTRGYTKVFAEALREAVAVFDDIRIRVERSPFSAQVVHRSLTGLERLS
jgi:integrase